jgi:hypothetical protein
MRCAANESHSLGLTITPVKDGGHRLHPHAKLMDICVVRSKHIVIDLVKNGGSSRHGARWTRTDEVVKMGRGQVVCAARVALSLSVA